eukprot:TRINITY_DN15033_c4_g1_i1.p1 TRINITY_DN15033_c4_g1~~TRINITY_DN15033_c4_g1_i1.p1  ORF type:complete len:361 (-),score=61.21 TRINITY_DN15033_c4_g1_i1:60-1040(-)
MAASLASDSEPCCRICHLTAEESDEPLISPCCCDGSIGYAHSDCLIDWLKHSAATSSEWRCDICHTPFEVKSDPGKPPMLKFLRKPLLDFIDFDAPIELSRLVHVLLVSTLQTLITCLGSSAASMLYMVAGLMCAPIPSSFSGYIEWPLAIPAMLVDMLTLVMFFILLLVKIGIARESYTFASWVIGDTSVVEQMLLWIVELLTATCNAKLIGLMAFNFYFSTQNLSRLFTDNRFGALGWIFMKAADGFMQESSTEPLADDKPIDTIARRSHNYQAWFMMYPGAISAMANIYALILLVKVSFFQGQPTPVAILDTASKHASSKKRD